MKVITLSLALICISSLCAQSLSDRNFFAQEEKWEQGFEVEKRIQGEARMQRDTIILSDIVKGLDQHSFFIDHRGDTVDYRTFENKVILLDFWFLACLPCIRDLPRLSVLQDAKPNTEFEVITFCNDSKERLQKTILKNKDVNFRIVPNIYLVPKGGYPTKMLIDKKGTLLAHKGSGSGAEGKINLLKDEYLPLIEEALK